MTARTRPVRTPPRGFTLLEAIIAMTIMVIGVVGTISTLTYGNNASRAARSQTLATAAAQELLAGLSALPTTDGRLTPTTSSATVPTTFGPLLSSGGTVTTTGSYTWSDGSAVPGVRTDVQLNAAPERMLEMQRRWVVWDYVPPGMPAGQLIRIISVSVVYRDPTLREVVVYGQKPNLGSLLLNIVSG
jgi:prepilin-type N-terminal cleavage/methylation domain-containing protein